MVEAVESLAFDPAVPAGIHSPGLQGKGDVELSQSQHQRLSRCLGCGSHVKVLGGIVRLPFGQHLPLVAG